MLSQEEAVAWLPGLARLRVGIVTPDRSATLESDVAGMELLSTKSHCFLLQNVKEQMEMLYLEEKKNDYVRCQSSACCLNCLCVKAFLSVM